MDQFLKLDPARVDEIFEIGQKAYLGDPEAEAQLAAISDREFQTALRIREMRQRAEVEAAAAKQQQPIAPVQAAAAAGDGLRGMYRLQQLFNRDQPPSSSSAAPAREAADADVGRGWNRISRFFDRCSGD